MLFSVGSIGIALMLALVSFLYDFTGTHATTFIKALISHGISLILLVVTVLKISQSKAVKTVTSKSLEKTTN